MRFVPGTFFYLVEQRIAAKPIRVFLQSGARGLDIFVGSWPLGNQEVVAFLAYREYDFQFVYGEGGHTLKHAASIFPDTLRWLWQL